MHNLSDREYDHGHTKHQLLSDTEIRSVERYAVFDVLKQYVFIGGGNMGDGVLRCPAASEIEQQDLQVGASGADGGVGSGIQMLPDSMWDNSFPGEKGCEHYLLNSQSAASNPTRDARGGEQQGAEIERWSPPPQGARARASRGAENAARRDATSSAVGNADLDLDEAGPLPSTAAGGCLGGPLGRRVPSGEASSAQVEPDPVRAASSGDAEAGASLLEISDAEHLFGHFSLSLYTEARTNRPGISGGACLSTRRVQEGSGRGARNEESAGPLIKEQEQGLICRILRVFMRETPDSTYRFWLASCVEAFLRGSDMRSQVLMARSGLLQHLVDGILNSQGSGNLQTNFDLLGELIKCNPEVFAILNDILDDSTYTAFMQVVVSNLVDSNVFLRAVILSLEFFSARRVQLQELGSSYNIAKCKMRRFLQHNTLRLLRDLMTVITVEDVNQENICCLNTALSLFILARSHGQLHVFIEALYRWELANQQPGAVTGNFLALLKFWLEYYLYRSLLRCLSEFAVTFPCEFSDCMGLGLHDVDAYTLLCLIKTCACIVWI